MPELIKGEWLESALAQQRQHQQELDRQQQEAILELARLSLIRLNRIEQEIAANLPGVIMECLRHLVGSMADQLPEALIKEALNQSLKHEKHRLFNGNEAIAVVVPPRGVGCHEQFPGEGSSQEDEIKSTLPAGIREKLNFITNNQLQPGDCIIQWGAFWGDYRLETRLEVLKEWLLNLPPFLRENQITHAIEHQSSANTEGKRGIAP